MDSLKVLLVDDETCILDGYRRGLRNRFQLDTAQSGQEALELVSHSTNYAVVISDMRMPGMSGLDLLARVRELSPDTVRIMLTGNADQQTVIDAINQGEIYKFLTKPCDISTLEAAISDGIQRFKQIKKNRTLLDKNASKVKGLSQQLSYQSTHDPLTGLDNRHSFEIRLYEALDSAQNEGMQHAVCYLDLDHLHVINDSYGIAAGDKLLKEIAQLLKHGRRRGDMVARLAGDEFAILFYDCNLDQARKIVEKLHQEIRALRIEKGNKTICTGASLGLTPITSEDENVATIIYTAEAACAMAREKGLNILHVADDQDEELKKRLGEVLLVSDINQALEEGRFKLYFQTIAPTNQGCSEGLHYELLLRMEQEGGSIYLPNKFLPAAEHYYLTPKIDCWVIRTYVNWLRDKPEQLERLAVCSINLSGLSLGNSEVLDCIIESFTSNQIPPEKICFEVTETAAILRLETAMEFITALKARGFLFALDDFGSGYSSFAYLRDLPVDYLKIDGTFVKNMDSDLVNRNMVKTITELGHSMGIKTIAEFVENENILKFLQENEVDYSQGFIIARPRPLHDLE